jgi:hypothetical protein
VLRERWEIPSVDQVTVEERAGTFTKPSVKTSTKLQGLKLAISMLRGNSGVKVAPVATGFPTGLMPLRLKLNEVRSAARDGADEIDMVIDRGVFWRANRVNTPYGLSARIWTNKGSKILKFVSKLPAGVGWANTYNKFDPTNPFGGHKESGFGGEGGLHGFSHISRFLNYPQFDGSALSRRNTRRRMKPRAVDEGRHAAGC